MKNVVIAVFVIIAARRIEILTVNEYVSACVYVYVYAICLNE